VLGILLLAEHQALARLGVSNLGLSPGISPGRSIA
jgi:hypothetical protein